MKTAHANRQNLDSRIARRNKKPVTQSAAAMLIMVLAIAVSGCSNSGGGNGPADPDSSSSDCDPSSSAYVWDLSSDSKDPSSSGKEDLCSSSQNKSSSSSSIVVVDPSSSSVAVYSSSSSSLTVYSSSSKGVVSSSSFVYNPSSSSFVPSSSSNVPSSSSNKPSSSSATPSSSSQDWSWVSKLAPGGEYYQTNQMGILEAFSQIGPLLDGCAYPQSFTPSPELKIFVNASAVLNENAFRPLTDIGCLVPVKLSGSNPEKWYAIAGVPTTDDDDAVLAKKFDNDGLGYIYKGILECMAREGSSECREETHACPTDASKSLTFYRGRIPTPTANALNELKNALCGHLK